MYAANFEHSPGGYRHRTLGAVEKSLFARVVARRVDQKEERRKELAFQAQRLVAR